MTKTVKAANAAEFLALVPHLLGFHPRDSLVMVPFSGSRTLGAVRYDLPATAADVDRLAATVVGMACRVSNVDAVAITVWSEDADTHGRYVAALESRSDACGLAVVDTLWSTPTMWGRFGDDERHPHLAGERAPDALDADQASGSELPLIGPTEREALADALTALEDAIRVVCGASDDDPADDPARPTDPRALSAVCALDDLPDLFERVLDWNAEALSPFDAATLTWCLARPALRDIALVQWCRGFSAGDEALDAQLRWEDGEDYPPHIAMNMWGEGGRPDPRRLLRALEIVRRIAAAAPEGKAAGPFATSAWIAWALGRSTHAAVYAERACEEEPEHGLAEIVMSFVSAGHLPDWAFQRS
ncbi:DUF4192 family protein [Microbacterium sp. SLBN-146]|uniref:DUF4192 family protein n=1 Tax=Microbacterium sp. SLBN-146 TaxID=2768457 RepID=UPI001151A158|nr:DUF4192 family protein [Microbacterium sp. SLBN-146]TQJ30653.1 uncharacterized protein DUF4192 [Microbacterium sp. SLBN-146]